MRRRLQILCVLGDKNVLYYMILKYIEQMIEISPKRTEDQYIVGAIAELNDIIFTS